MLDSYMVTANSAAPVLVAYAPLGTGKGKLKIYVANQSGTTDTYLGDANVTAANGYQLVKQNGSTVAYRQEFELFGGESIYAICSSGQTAPIAVIVSGL